jgi:hypothetical protein
MERENQETKEAMRFDGWSVSPVWYPLFGGRWSLVVVRRPSAESEVLPLLASLGGFSQAHSLCMMCGFLLFLPLLRQQASTAAPCVLLRQLFLGLISPDPCDQELSQ